MILDESFSASGKSFKISRRGDQRRVAGAKDHRGGSAEARGAARGTAEASEAKDSRGQCAKVKRSK